MVNFYKTAKWLRTRDKRLRMDEYLCQECRRYGKTTAAQTVHHIFPLEQFPMLGLIIANLISLCFACHDKMHDRNSDALTEAGERWRDRAIPALEALGFKVR